MRIDVISIFPEYLSALDVSLIGKARADNILDIRIHDLRDFTFDRHKTVDDTPYGGGAGMVMKAEPWALALESVVSTVDDPVELIIPSPAGEVFDQQIAYELSEKQHLAFACGRYEGIDERVYEWAQDHPLIHVRPMSLGDYVLNGGVAVLAMVEAIGRLVPGVIGNPESLVEESHAEGMLEYPVYTKPANWRDREVPEILLSGNHARIEDWRTIQRLRRTAERRPDLFEHLQSDNFTKSVQAEFAQLKKDMKQ